MNIIDIHCIHVYIYIYIHIYIYIYICIYIYVHTLHMNKSINKYIYIYIYQYFMKFNIVYFGKELSLCSQTSRFLWFPLAAVELRDLHHEPLHKTRKARRDLHWGSAKTTTNRGGNAESGSKRTAWVVSRWILMMMMMMMMLINVDDHHVFQFKYVQLFLDGIIFCKKKQLLQFLEGQDK